MSRKKGKEATYSLTPKGAIYVVLGFDEEQTQKLMDTLELQARRRNCNALLINQDGWDFINVHKEK